MTLALPLKNLLRGMMLLGALVSANAANAQLTGIKTIPGDYATVTAAVNALNTSGVGAGGVTFELAAGTTFTESIPVITATGTATDSIVFKRSAAAGANPKIIPATAGTIAISTAVAGLGVNGDAIVTISGGDYIVFDGIDLTTNASFTTTTTKMEYGYMLKKASATNACKNVTIRNCTVTLDKAIVNSFGIFVSNFIGTTAAVPTSIGGRTENVKIFNNTITNAFGGIQLRGYAHTSAPYDLMDQNIQVGEDGGNTINNFGSGSIAMYGIYTIYQNNLVIANNTINNIANGGAVGTGALYGIYAFTAANANATLHHNTITLGHGGTTTVLYPLYAATGASGTTNAINIYNNNITGCTSTTLTTGDFFGIYQTGTPNAANIYNNSITNNVLAGTTAIFYGIYNSGAVVSQTAIYNNTISGNSKVGTGAMYDLYNSPGTACTSNIYDNTLSNNNSNNATHYGLYLNASLLLNVYRNNIFGLTATGASGEVYGITLAAGPLTTHIYNNFISNLTAPVATSTADAIRGINITSTTANSSSYVSYNTIYLNATSTGADFSTSGIYHTASPFSTVANLTLRNNNVVNLSVASSTGTTAAFRRSLPAVYNYNNNSGSNNFYAGAPSATKVIYHDGVTGYQTLSAFKDKVTPADAGSVTEMPPFVNVSSPPYDLHITPAVATQLESGGVPVASPIAITNDYDLNTRGAVPDIGADEFAGIVQDQTGPVIAYSPLGSSCVGGDRTLTVIISDATGVPTSGLLMPRIYYRKNAGTWYSQAGTLASGSGTSGIWNFTIAAATLGGVGVGDVVTYYIVAQDAATIAHLSSNPSGVAATDVNTVSAAPSNPARYSVGTVMNGTYTINPAGTGSTNFRDFASAGASLGCGITGPVTINVVSGSGPYNDQLLIDSIPGTSVINTVTLNGNGNTISYLTDNGDRKAVVMMNGADHVTINNLVITPAATLAAEFAVGVQLYNDADSNTINNCTITINPAVTATTSAGIQIASIAGATSSTAAGDSRCDGNIFSQNTISGGYGSIVMVANSSTYTISNNVVSNNTIRDFYIYGIYANGHNGLLIKGNDIARPNRAVPSSYYGTLLTGYANNCTVDGNRYHDPFTAVPTNTGTAYVMYQSADALVGTPNIWKNNLIYNMTGSGTHYYGYVLGANTRLHHNTISSEVTTTTGTATTYCMYIGADNVDVKNNIVTISRGGTGVKTAMYYSSGANFTANNNLYYMNSTTGTSNYGYYTSAQATFAAWKTASAQDAASPTPVSPAYANPATGDFTPTNLSLDNLGTPVGVTSDILGIARSVTAPDLGAYEFGSYPLNVNVLSFTAKKEGRDVGVQWSVGVEDNMSAYVVERSLDGKSFTDAGDVKASGLSKYNFNDIEVVKLATGNQLYYRLRTIETNGKLAYSKIAVVKLDAAADVFTVYPNPFAASVTIRVTAATAGTCEVVIKDLNGRTVASQSSNIQAGTSQVGFNGLGRLAHGTYQVIANINGHIEAATIAK